MTARARDLAHLTDFRAWWYISFRDLPSCVRLPSVQLKDEQLSWWRELKTEFDADATRKAEYKALRDKRDVNRPQIVKLLDSFLSGAINIEQLRSTWDAKTRTEWTGFGLKGLSSAMVLNILVKHIPDQVQTAEELRKVVRAPKDEHDGRNRMAAFETFLEGQIKTGNVARRQMQTARIPFFVSAFWHMQDSREWPMFYVSARQVFHRRGLFSTKGNIVDDYFTFRDVYQSLMVALNASSWDVEQMCWFDIERDRSAVPDPISVDPDTETVNEQGTSAGEDPSCSLHTQAQWLLASIGKAFGCKIWIAANDHGKQWNGQRLGDMAMPTLPSLGIGNAAAEKIVRLIDVLWIKSTNHVVAAFEVEHSTSIYSGLLRMADLTVLSPNISVPLYIVAPEQRLDKVRRQLSRPSLQALELHERCGFFSVKALVEQAEHIKKWAKDPDSIDKLAEYVQESDEEEDRDK